MKYDTKNSFGKRMVKEAKIKEIGSGSDVTGTNDGTNWTSLTIDEDTYGIPAAQEYYSGADNFIIVDNNSMTIGFSIVNGSNIVLDTTQSEPYIDLADDISVDSVEAGDITISATNNANLIYCDDNTKPFEISSTTGAWVRIDATGLVSLTSVDSNTSTAHLYEFKADGIYLDNVKITS